jgi:hypothetical protein
MVSPASGAQISSRNPTTKIRLVGKPTEAMDFTATATIGKKEAKMKKPAKDLTLEELQAESDNRGGQREAARARAAAAKLEEEQLKANYRIIGQRPHTNSELLAQKGAQQVVMMIK